jgi:DNA-binding beta-propeller fold protein YncE
MTGRIAVGTGPRLVKSDGADLWVADISTSDVKRVRASDGELLETWTGAGLAFGVLVARGRIYITGDFSVFNPVGTLYVIDPSMPAGVVGTLSSALGTGPKGVTTDGSFIWTANTSGSVSKVNPDSGATTNISTGFSAPNDILFDGSNLWVIDQGDNMLKKLDSSGNILQSRPVGSEPQFAVFDGSNIWVPSLMDSSITVVRARDGLVLATLTGNGLNGPEQAAFDGERILVTNVNGNSISLWKAADLTPIGVFPTGASTQPVGACSDGTYFWITLLGTNQLARF